MRLTALLTALALTLAACGGGDDEPEPLEPEPLPAAPTAVVAQAPADEEDEQLEPAPAAVEQQVVDRSLPVASIAIETVNSYEVQPNDTLFKIAESFGTTVDVLVRLNGIADANLITVGQLLTISEDPATLITPPQPLESTLESVIMPLVVDGDTIEVTVGDGRSERVRLLGIDAPDPDTGEAFAVTAAERLTALFSTASAVFLERDSTERDEFGRLLRYVWTRDVNGDHHLLNAVMVAEGLAVLLTSPPDVKYDALLDEAETAASASRLGLWSLAATPAPAAQPAPAAETTETAEDAAAEEPASEDTAADEDGEATEGTASE